MKKENDEEKKKDEKVLKARDKDVSMLKELRRSGLGEYFVKAELQFDYLKAEGVNTNKQTVKELENPLGTNPKETLRILELDPFIKAVAVSGAGISNESNTITIKDGKLIWKPVENATTYDIYGDVTTDSKEGYLGKFYLDKEDDGNNEINYKSITVKNHRSIFDADPDFSRVLCATGIKNSEEGIPLSELIVFPNKGNSALVNPWYTYANVSGIAVRFLIVPRNTDSLYINSNLSGKDRLSPLQEGKVKAHSVFISDIPIKEFFSYIFGENIETLEKENKTIS